MNTIDKIKKDWNNIEPIGKMNIFLGAMLIITAFVFPGKLDLNTGFAIMGALVMWVGSQSKKEPHPEYQRKLTDYEEEK